MLLHTLRSARFLPFFTLLAFVLSASPVSAFSFSNDFNTPTWAPVYDEPVRTHEKAAPWIALTSPENKEVVDPAEPLVVSVEYDAWHFHFSTKNKQHSVTLGSFKAIELLLNGEPVALTKFGMFDGKAGSTTFEISPDMLPEDVEKVTLQARAYSVYKSFAHVPERYREKIKGKVNKVVAESEIVTVQLGVLEAPVVALEAQDDSFVLSWENAYPSLNYTVERKIDDGSFETLAEGMGMGSYTDSDTGTLGVYTYKVIATNRKGEFEESDELYAYVSELGNGVLKIDTTGTDTDEDGLTDFLETNKYQTDINNPDTDGDGISDGDEAFTLFTDPTKADTDGNGTTDDQEDFDNDGIHNKDEIVGGTDPWSEDSDLDRLTDYEEIHTYNTNPTREDTDDDGMSDGDEVVHGTDPLVADTDGDGVLDGDEVFTVTVETSDTEKDAEVDVSVTMDLEGKDLGSVSISNVGEANPFLQSSMPGYVGAPFAFATPASFNGATLQFTFDSALVNDPNFEPAIYYFNEQTNLLELLPNQTVDLTTHTVSVDVSHFSTYILLNKTKVDEFWATEMKPPFEGNLENIKLVIGFAIDSSGSMQLNDPDGLRKEAAKDLVDNMDDNDQAAVIGFNGSATVLAPLTSDKEVIKKAIDQIDSSDGTDLGAGIQAALEQLATSTSEAKYIIMLTDGRGLYDRTLTQQAIDQGVTIYTVGLGSSVDAHLLTTIAEATGGKYYHASTASDLSDIFVQTSQETIDLTTDTDQDGLSDYHEKRRLLVNTSVLETKFDDATYPEVVTDPNMCPDTGTLGLGPNCKDSDGDGLLDGEELVYNSTTGHFDMLSDPTKADTDNDGINDKIDPNPLVYDITDRTLALTASLSYTNLQSYKGELVGDKGESELSDFRIVVANDSGPLQFNDFFDGGLGSVAIKISRTGKNDAVIFGIRGTEPTKDTLRDFSTDIALGISLNTKQSKQAFREYKKLAKSHPNADLYIAGHSLGGRLTQDVLYKVYDANDGTFGFFKSDIATPVHSATFNALGYNSLDFTGKAVFGNKKVLVIIEKLNNYYYKNDLVGEGLGDSVLFQRLGLNRGPWVAKDENGNVLARDFPSLPYEPTKFHNISLFLTDKDLEYPGSLIY